MVSQIKSLQLRETRQRWRLTNKRFLFPVFLFAMLVSPATREMTVTVLADAFWQVAAYVAATLTVYHAVSARMSHSTKLSAYLQRSQRFQVIFAAFMGALPGCGGAIIVMTQFVRGRLSFGSVVAVLTATMGDAAFLLLAAKPLTGLFTVGVGLSVGMISGWLVDTLHGGTFMQPVQSEMSAPEHHHPQSDTQSTSLRWQGYFWQWLLLPSAFVAVSGSFQIDLDTVFHFPQGSTSTLGAIFALTAMVLWSLSRDIKNYQDAVSEDPKPATAKLFQRVAQDTNFVTTWVIGAFLCFEIVMRITGWDLATIFTTWSPVMPLLGVMIGLIPGCGPQILVTSLYIQGAIPLSAQLGNAISNDGDALFPAIALAPKAALLATVYSGIPALLISYGFYWHFE
ncbi:putative manganese transporter [Photobacterium sp. R1]